MKVRTVKLMCMVVGLLLSLPAYAVEKLLPFEASMKATRYGAININLNGKMHLENNGDTWTFSITSKKGAISSTEKSEGIILDDNRYVPTSYKKNTKVFLVKENVEWHFDRENKLISGKVQKDKFEYPLNDNIYDPLSYQLALRQKLKAGDPNLTIENLRYKKPETFQFAIIGEELLEINGRPVMTKIIKQLKPIRGDSKKLIWVAPEFDYITVRFANYEDDKIKDLIRITSLEMKE